MFSKANKIKKWREAMTEEINAILVNITWDLVPFDASKIQRTW